MSVTVIVGTQWGDEGKGKVIDYLTVKYDLIARFQGGNNAGHTIRIGDDVHKFHLIPSGVMHPGKKLIIGNGTVLDLDVLRGELDSLEEIGVTDIDLNISDRANIIMPYHRAADGVQERKLGEKNIGTTGRGIGPAYSDKIARRGIRMCDLLEPDALLEKIENGLDHWKPTISMENVLDTPLTPDFLLEKYSILADYFRPRIVNTSRLVNRAVSSGKSVLFEGAQGALLDVDFGTYPYVTSSHTVSGGVTIGVGIGPTKIDKVIGVIKAYTTRVGEGPFPTELKDELGAALQAKGGEIGTTTGRPRRCGWLDLVLLKHSVMVSGVTAGALTKIDVLDEMDEIKVCTHYEIEGVRTDVFPPTITQLEKAVPVYVTLPGGFGLNGGMKDEMEHGGRGKLSENLRRYVEFIEKEIGIPMEILSFSPKRSDTVEI